MRAETVLVLFLFFFCDASGVFQYSRWKVWVSKVKGSDNAVMPCEVVGFGPLIFGGPEFRFDLKLSSGGVVKEQKCLEANGGSYRGDVEVTGHWMEMEGDMSTDKFFKLEIFAWEDDDLAPCSYGSNEVCNEIDQCVISIKGGAPSYGTTVTHHKDCITREYQRYAVTLSWHWWPVNCKELPAVGADNGCSNVAPGQWCTVKCTDEYLPDTADYFCDSKNDYEGNPATTMGTKLNCI
eukprot:Hpha_TRINITY_DN12050_c0_g1::TRINITY_DN12050_c0_g1_i1::g.141281::m.141281